MSTFVPIFIKDGHEFFILHEEFVAKDSEAAYRIGVGTMFVEGILLDFKFKSRVVELPDEGMLHAAATMGPYSVAIISGPIYVERKET